MDSLLAKRLGEALRNANPELFTTGVDEKQDEVQPTASPISTSLIEHLAPKPFIDPGNQPTAFLQQMISDGVIPTQGSAPNFDISSLFSQQSPSPVRNFIAPSQISQNQTQSQIPEGPLPQMSHQEMLMGLFGPTSPTRSFQAPPAQNLQDTIQKLLPEAPTPNEPIYKDPKEILDPSKFATPIRNFKIPQAADDNISQLHDPVIPEPPETHTIAALKPRVIADLVKTRGGKLPALTAVISIPDRKLVLSSGGNVLKTYPIAVGKDNTPSPTGEFKVIEKLTNPGASILGARWMGFLVRHDAQGYSSYGIHGNNAPTSIGTKASHGCIRMFNPDVKELYNYLKMGDAVNLYNKPLGQLGFMVPTGSEDN